MDASTNSSTSVTDYLGMPVMRFYEIWKAIIDVFERKAKHAKEAQKSAKTTGKAPKKKRRR